MRCLFFAILLASGACFAQDHPPRLLLDGAHCLATDKQDWFGLAQHIPSDLNLAYYIDTKSYPGTDLLYIMDYTAPIHSAGRAFALLVDGKEPRFVLRIQYGVQFRRAVDGTGRVELINPSMGGIWTQEHLIAAIREVENGEPTFTVPYAGLLISPDPISCQSPPLDK